MMSFDFNQHFKTYSSKRFYDQKTYGDLLAEASAFSETITNEEIFALKIKSPYLTFVALLALYSKKKKAVLISVLETEAGVEKCRSQVSFKTILTDESFNALKKSSSLSFEERKNDSPFIIVFSSGTTNLPKGVALSFDNIYYSALGFIEYFKQTAEECSLMNLPHNHVGGLMTLWRAFFSGGRVTTELTPPLDFISLVPLQLKRWLKEEDKLVLLKQCRVILIGGAPLTDELKTEAEKNGLTLYETYGMSETASLVTINGEVLPYRDLQLDKENLFAIKGKTLCLGYYQNQMFLPHLHEWFTTNDRGEKIHDRFKFLERADLIFISGGENINPLSVEEAAKRHPAIKDAYLLPLKDEQWGEMGVMLYECTSSHSLSAEELKNHLKMSLHPHHIPKFFFEHEINLEGFLKPKRSELKKTAYELYIKSIFSYDLLGTQEKPLIVFFHGFTGDKEDLKEIAAPFLSSHQQLFIDLPGHGKTLMKHFHSHADIMTKLRDLILLFSDRPIFYGYSMGGRVALKLALNSLTPEKLILESAGLGLSSEEEKKARSKHDLDLFDKFDDTESFILNWYGNPMFKHYRNSKCFQADIEKKSAHSLDEWRDSQLYLSQGSFPLQSETLLKLASAHFPVHYLYGEDDPKYAAYAPFFKRTSMIPAASHNPHKTHPLEINDCLTQILK
jgi:O-succinylbenzoic acid--CoA ligase